MDTGEVAVSYGDVNVSVAPRLRCLVLILEAVIHNLVDVFIKNELVKHRKNGMQEIEKHYRQYYDNLLLYLTKHGFSKDDAEDVIQNTYLRVLEYYPNEEIDKVFWSVLEDVRKSQYVEINNGGMTGTIAAEHKYDVYDMDYKQILDKSDAVDDTPNPEQKAINKELFSDILCEIEMRPSHIERVLKMYFIHDMDYDRISKETGKGYDNVRKIVSRFREDIERKSVENSLRRRPGPEPNNLGQIIKYHYNPNDWPVIKRN